VDDGLKLLGIPFLPRLLELVLRGFLVFQPLEALLPMLPDHPALKQRLSAFLTARMKFVHAVHAAPLGDLPFVHIQEGNRVMMVWEDGQP